METYPKQSLPSAPNGTDAPDEEDVDTTRVEPNMTRLLPDEARTLIGLLEKHDLNPGGVIERKLYMIAKSGK